MPRIKLKPRLKKVIISGVSRMPDPEVYFNDLGNDLEELYYEFKNTLIIEFYLDYLNSGSAKWMYTIIQRMESLARKKGLIEIYWKYDQDDESIQITGEVLKSKTKLPFKLIPVED